MEAVREWMKSYVSNESKKTKSIRYFIRIWRSYFGKELETVTFEPKNVTE